jgi:tRNA pseudouridine synthase 10
MIAMDVMEKAKKILEYPVCNRCLGRQFAQLLSGYTNEQRGAALRLAVAMSIDRSREESKDDRKEAEKERSSGAQKNIHSSHNAMDMTNFSGFNFHNLDVEKTAAKNCVICSGFFDSIDKWITKMGKAMKNRELRTFMVGTRLPYELVSTEESIWEHAGIDFCEPLKGEINREVGKRAEKALGIKFSKNPDGIFMLNVADGRVTLEINPIFIYGEYQKLKRGIPQTKWPSGKYKTSVEQIVAKPFMLATKARGHKLHGLGREDIDARCLGWRPFVLELLEPRKRAIDVKRLAKRVHGPVNVRSVRFSDIVEVRRIKEMKSDKTYSALVICEKPIEKSMLKKLASIKSIKQKTPQRVLHRRADKYRNRAVRSLSAKLVGNKKFVLKVRCEAGLYVKELVSGDNGRTQPSVSQLLGVNCVVKDLDVLAIHAKTS